MATHQRPLSTDLLEEYNVCQEKAASLTDNIWKTALILGVGSIAGIVNLSGKSTISDDLRPWLSPVVSLFAVGILVVWWRLARRWWSIGHAMFRRMEHIERQSQLRTNLYVRYLNQLADKMPDCQEEELVKFATKDEEATLDQPFLDKKLIEDLYRLSRNYEHRGIQPMMEFVIKINIAAWVAFFFLQIAPCIQKILGVAPSTIRLVTVVIYGAFVFGYGFWQWRKK